MMREYEEMIFKSARWRSFKEEGGGKHHCVYDTWRLQWRERVASDNLAICCVQREMIAWLPPYWSRDTTLLPPSPSRYPGTHCTCHMHTDTGVRWVQSTDTSFCMRKGQVRWGTAVPSMCGSGKNRSFKRAKNSCYHDVGTFVFTDIFEYIKPTRHPTIHCRIYWQRQHGRWSSQTRKQSRKGWGSYFCFHTLLFKT